MRRERVVRVDRLEVESSRLRVDFQAKPATAYGKHIIHYSLCVSHHIIIPHPLLTAAVPCLPYPRTRLSAATSSHCRSRHAIEAVRLPRGRATGDTAFHHAVANNAPRRLALPSPLVGVVKPLTLPSTVDSRSHGHAHAAGASARARAPPVRRLVSCTSVARLCPVPPCPCCQWLGASAEEAAALLPCPGGASQSACASLLRVHYSRYLRAQNRENA